MKKSFYSFLLAMLSLILLNSCCSQRQCPDVVEEVPPMGRQKMLSEISRLKSRHRMEGGNQYGVSIKQEIIETINLKRQVKAVKEVIPLPIKVLVLSGGGPKGAYGAGFLNGLKDADSFSDGDLNYDIVTGISTGSIQSTFAFLGTEYYNRLTSIYTEEEWEKFIPQKPLISLALCGNSLRRIDGFRKKLSEYVTDEIIDKVAERGADGLRRLYIGTVDLDSGLFIRWDMVDIAKTGQYDYYREVILASCAIPVIFPPVALERQIENIRLQELHVDGGARHMAYIKQNMLDVIAAAQAAGQKVAPSIDFILNNSFYPNKICAQNKILNVATRAATTLMKQSIENDVFRAYVIACGNQLPFKITYMDADITDFEDDFYPNMREDMRLLYEKAYEKAQTQGWSTQLPDEKNWEDVKKLCPKED